jgi:hypothetical protein
MIKKSSLYMGSKKSEVLLSEAQDKLSQSVGAIDAKSNKERITNMKTRIMDNNKTHYSLGSVSHGISMFTKLSFVK